jgi:hypothetical protein
MRRDFVFMENLLLMVGDDAAILGPVGTMRGLGDDGVKRKIRFETTSRRRAIVRRPGPHPVGGRGISTIA